MLYVFFVGSGTMMTFDMNLAVENVAALQREIERVCSIPMDIQVLLISGGTALDPSVKVCNYGAGTDTNPIFLFTKQAGDDDFQSFASSDSDSEVNMKERVDAFENMAADYQTLAARSQLAREFAEMAIHERKLCNRLVDSQHLQQQGWAAVIANLEDTIAFFRHHVEVLESESQEYFKSRPLYLQLLENFHHAVDQLAEVPLLPSLLTQSGSEDEVTSTHHTLFSKYCSEPRIALEKLAEQCKKWIDQFHEETLAALKVEVNKVLSTAEEPSMKEVKGIEERLFMLNQLMESACKACEDQCKYAEALNLHHSRVSSSNDLSVLNDLCRAHQMQLNDMLQNHTCLRDTRERCMKGKVELCRNLQQRISWVTYSQNQMVNLNNKIAIFRENVRRVKDHLDVVQQIHLAPMIYVRTIAEIQRRKNFSTNFLKWASSLSEQASELYKKEVDARKAFNGIRSVNFVNSLFPGMEDLPPPFATECPEPFDMLLPNITPEDIANLKKQLPELSALMDVSLTDQMPQICLKSQVSDSAFSTPVPSSQCAACQSHSCTSSHGVQMFRTEVLTSVAVPECVNTAQELSSPVSPFEDPLLAASVDTELASNLAKLQLNKKADDPGVDKKLILTEVSSEKEVVPRIEEEQNNVDSDGDEFERVDSMPKLYDAFVSSSEASNLKQSVSEIAKKGDEPDVLVPCDSKIDSSYARGELLQALPSDEPDSLLTSNDFHSADYFIDDSMPSSYTESTGVEKGQHMTKSHHVIVAELQQQLGAKDSVVGDSQGSLPMSRSNILKLHGTISAFQRLVRELQDYLVSELNILKDHVREQRSLLGDEISDVMEKVNAIVNTLQSQAELEKANSICEVVKREQAQFEKYQGEIEHTLEVQAEKLEDAHREIEMYQEQINRGTCVMQEMEQNYEDDLLKIELDFAAKQAELTKHMLLEQELELESLREEMKNSYQEKDDEIRELKKVISDKQIEVQTVISEKEKIESEIREKMLKEQEEWMKSMEAQYVSKHEAAISKSIEQLQQTEKQEIENLRKELSTLESELCEKFTKEFQEKLEQKLVTLKLDFESEKEKLLKEQKEQLEEEGERKSKILAESIQEQCKREIEVMQSRIKLAYSTTSLDRKSDSVCGSPTAEVSLSTCAVHEKQIQELREELEVSKKYQQELADLYENEVSSKQHVTELQLQKQKLEKDHKVQLDQLVKSQISLNQTLQASYSKTVCKVKEEKEDIIRDLRSEIAVLKDKLISVLETVTEEFKHICDKPVEVSGDSARVNSDVMLVVSNVISRVREKMECPERVSSPRGDSTQALAKRVEELQMELLQEREKFTKLSDNLLKPSSKSKLSFQTCEAGDIVLILYDEKYKNYLAFHLGSGNMPHFLHTASMSVLNLEIPPRNACTSWTLAVVIDKEYCIAKKPTNRYNVPTGTRFYRVRVMPWVQEKSRPATEMQVRLSECSQAQSVSVPPSSGMPEGADKSSGDGRMFASTI